MYISILITMLFSAFFSGMEIAFVSSNRMLAEMDCDRDKLTSKPLSIFYQHPNNFVSTMLVGNNIVVCRVGKNDENAIVKDIDGECRLVVEYHGGGIERLDGGEVSVRW